MACEKRRVDVKGKAEMDAAEDSRRARQSCHRHKVNNGSGRM